MVGCLRSLSDEDLQRLSLQSTDRESLTSLVNRLKVKKCLFQKLTTTFPPSRSRVASLPKTILTTPQAFENIIGVSKSSCSMCSTYLKALPLGNRPAIRGTSGRIHPWALPPWETRVDVVEKVWDRVSKAVYFALVSNHLLYHDERRSASGSEHGQTLDTLAASTSNVDAASDSTGELPLAEQGMWTGK